VGVRRLQKGGSDDVSYDVPVTQLVVLQAMKLFGDGELQVRDLDLAGWLGYEQPRKNL
jgi:hypothetical protein